MKILKAEILDLQCKHYDTVVGLDIEGDDGEEYHLSISIAGYFPKPSKRELERGWEPDWGMDHIESEAHLEIAKKIVETLSR